MERVDLGETEEDPLALASPSPRPPPSLSLALPGGKVLNVTAHEAGGRGRSEEDQEGGRK